MKIEELEQEIVDLMYEHRIKRKDVARELGLAPNTVSHYLNTTTIKEYQIKIYNAVVDIIKRKRKR